MAENPGTRVKPRGPEGYKWRPLASQNNEFRILELFGVSYELGEEVIMASVHNVLGYGHPSYDALSYSWGNLKGTKKILLDKKVHHINENLHECLLVLTAHGVKNLWVDALCIDQDNPNEKAAQVQRMATIFQEADSVLIWLGSSSSTEGILRAFRKLDLSTLGQNFWGQAWLVPNLIGNSTFTEDFMRFLHCEYWYRTWIVQEIAVAKQIVLFCGAEHIDGTVFGALFSMAYWEQFRNEANRRWAGPSFSPFEHMVSLWNIRHFFKNRQPMDLLELLLDLRSGKTSLSLDRIYAVYGLAFDQRAFLAEPNYNLQPSQLCTQMTRRFIETTTSLDIVFFRQFLAMDGLPSWCCPFVQFDNFNGCSVEVQGLTNYINGKSCKLRCGDVGKFWNTTSSSLAADKKVLWEGQTLKVVGLRLGKVTGFDPLSETGDYTTGSRLITIFDSVSRLLMIHSHLYVQRDHNLGDLVLQILENEPQKRASGWVFNQIAMHWSSPHNSLFCISPNHKGGLSLQTSWADDIDLSRHTSLAADVEDMLRRVGAGADSQLDLEAMAGKMRHVMEKIVLDVYWMARFFLIDYENVGFMPFSTAGSDGEVWLLAHCSMPVILEKVEPEGGAGRVSYHILSQALVDEVNVHGSRCSVMNGEAWKAAKIEDLEYINIV